MSSLVRLIMTVDARYDLLLTIPICVEVYSTSISTLGSGLIRHDLKKWIKLSKQGNTGKSSPQLLLAFRLTSFNNHLFKILN